jgi:hypothetical protein
VADAFAPVDGFAPVVADPMFGERVPDWIVPETSM